jgi:heme exporter protein B
LPPMNSSWSSEIFALMRKELRSENRSRSAAYTALMLSITTVFTLAFAFFGREMSGEGSAGMLWAALLFAGVGTLTRVFVSEEEQGTGDLLRLWARPHAVFWGKALFGMLQMVLTAALVSLLFLMLTGVAIAHPWLLFSSLLGGAAALAGTVTLASALISRGSNRGALAGVVALPLLLPLVALGVSAGRSAFEGLGLQSGWAACAGIWLYTLAVFAVAPHIFAAIWREP